MDDPAEEADELSLLIRRIIALLAVRRRTPGVARSAWGWGEVGEGRKNGAGEGGEGRSPPHFSQMPPSHPCRDREVAPVDRLFSRHQGVRGCVGLKDEQSV